MTSINKRRSLAGSYCPSFFNIKVNSCKDIYSASLLTDNVLFHEYIHFMQDITTTAGYERLFNLLAKIDYLCRELHGKSEVLIPYEIKNEEWGPNEEIEKIMDCHDDYNWKEYKILEIIEDKKRGVVLKLETPDGIRETLFGAYQIEEIMAECCESTHPLYSPCDEYPYSLWEKFNEYFGYKLTKYDYARLSFVSLNNTFPGIDFYTMLKFVPKIEINLMMRMVYESKMKIKDYFRTETLKKMSWLYGCNFPGIVKWYSTCTKQNEKYDEYDKFIALLDNMLSPASEFNSFVENNGLPVVRDGKNNFGYGVKFDGDGDMYGLIALQSAVDVLFDKSAFDCPFRKFCEKFEDETKEERMTLDCLGTPWNYQKDEKTCIMSRMWKSLGFPPNVTRKN